MNDRRYRRRIYSLGFESQFCRMNCQIFSWPFRTFWECRGRDRLGRSRASWLDYGRPPEPSEVPMFETLIGEGQDGLKFGLALVCTRTRSQRAGGLFRLIEVDVIWSDMSSTAKEFRSSVRRIKPGSKASQSEVLPAVRLGCAAQGVISGAAASAADALLRRRPSPVAGAAAVGVQWAGRSAAAAAM
jgi:hypothetical protein